MWNKLRKLVYGDDCELQERMFRIVILAGVFGIVMGIIETTVVTRGDSMLIPIYLLFLLVIGMGLFLTFKYRRYDIAAMIIGIIIMTIVFPSVFFMSDGLNSGAAVWFALGILYVFCMFKGKRMYIFLAICIAVYAVTYIIGYNHPEMLVAMESKRAAYVDSFFSVTVVGMISGIILKTHMTVYEKEHKLNLEQKKEIEKSRDSKNALFANMSHEIRTPINAIIGLNEMIMRSNPDDEIYGYAKDISVASNMLLNQVNDILDLSQMEMQKMKIIPVKYQTEELFVELSELVRHRMEKKGLEFYIDIDKELPSVLIGDEKRIKQVLLNILDNAVKYTNEGSVILTARGERQDNGDVILNIKVADTGIGIKKEDLEHIYDAFNRVDERTNMRIMGSGLGLAITKQLVDLMNGEITVDSIYTKGSVFGVNIRQEVADDTSIGDVDYSKYSTKPEERYKVSFVAPEARVLVVDDNKMNSQIAAKLLQDTRMKIDTANSGEECLKLTKKKHYDIILLDYMMPIMNGEETLGKIRTQENGLCRESAIVALTGNALSGAREMHMKQGFDGYVEKPIQSKLLESELIKLLPEDIIEHIEESVVNVDNISPIQKASLTKRRKVCITTDCVADIPKDLLEKYGIEIMYLYIKTPHGRFADTKEIDSDSLHQYISVDKSTAYGDSVTVEEFEEFFANALTTSEHVVHISLASNTGRAHSVAMTAAKCFDHVKVIDSGMISGGQALIVLHAAKLAMEGKDYKEICDSVEKVKNQVRLNFILPGAEIFYRNGRSRALTAKICKALQLHPMGAMRQKRPILTAVLRGSVENAWKQGIKLQLKNKSKVNTDIVYITHVACSVKELELIVGEVKKAMPFRKIIVQKACFTNACNGGVGCISIAYYSM